MRIPPFALPVALAACSTPQPVAKTVTHYREHVELTDTVKYRIRDVIARPQGGTLRVEGHADRLQLRTKWQEYEVVEQYHRSFVLLWENYPKVERTEWLAVPHRDGYSDRYTIADVPAEQRRPVSDEWIETHDDGRASIRWSIRELVAGGVRPNGGVAAIQAGRFAFRIDPEVAAVAAMVPDDTVTLTLLSADDAIDVEEYELELARSLFQEGSGR